MRIVNDLVAVKAEPQQEQKLESGVIILAGSQSVLSKGIAVKVGHTVKTVNEGDTVYYRPNAHVAAEIEYKGDKLLMFYEKELEGVKS